MADLLLKLQTPDWFNPWGWTALGILAIILLVIALVLIIRAGGNKKAEDWEEEPAEAATARASQEVMEQPVEEKTRPAEDKKEEPAAKAATDEEKAEKKSATREITTDKKEERKSVAKETINEKKAAEKPAAKAASAEKDTQAKPAAKPVANAAKKNEDKSSNKTYHISKRSDLNRWQIKAAGAAKALKFFNTQAEAIDYAKVLAKNQDAHIVIHKEDGSFRKLTY